MATNGASVQDLISAVRSSDLLKVSLLLRAHPELIQMDVSASNEHRALHYAVLGRDVAMVSLLMDAGADARKGIFPHRDATSAFVLARDREYADIVAVIERAESQRSTETNIASTTVEPVQSQIAKSISSGDANRVRDLVATDRNVLRAIGRDGGLLSLAVKAGQLEIVRLLLDLGADVNERTLLQELEIPTPSWGMPLWHAALDNQLQIAELLLDRGADPNANVYASGWPLRNAWDHQDGALKNLLIARGAKLHPYMIAELHDVSAASALLREDVSPPVVEELLVSAADHGCVAIVELALPLLQWPLHDPRWHWVLIQPARGASGDTAGNQGRFASLNALLRHGVNPNVARFGQTALHFTAGRNGELNEQDRARFGSMLVDAGARLDLRDELLESTPLGWACRWGRNQLAAMLIDRGAPVDEPDTQSWATPLAWARKMKHHGIVALLQRQTSD